MRLSAEPVYSEMSNRIKIDQPKIPCAICSSVYQPDVRNRRHRSVCGMYFLPCMFTGHAPIPLARVDWSMMIFLISFASINLRSDFKPLRESQVVAQLVLNLAVIFLFKCLLANGSPSSQLSLLLHVISFVDTCLRLFVYLSLHAETHSVSWWDQTRTKMLKTG